MHPLLFIYIIIKRERLEGSKIFNNLIFGSEYLNSGGKHTHLAAKSPTDECKCLITRKLPANDLHNIKLIFLKYKKINKSSNDFQNPYLRQGTSHLLFMATNRV